jgi:hypothetical protein
VQEFAQRFLPVDRRLVLETVPHKKMARVQ